MWFYKENRIQKGKDALKKAGFINVKLLKTGERMEGTALLKPKNQFDCTKINCIFSFKSLELFIDLTI